MQKKILVTGGCGFIGSHTCLALLEKDYEVWVIDSLINSSPVSLERVKILSNKPNNIRFFAGDLRDINFLKEVFIEAKYKDTTFSGVIHFAGLKSIAESIKSPINYWDNNVSSTINLLRVMDDYKCRTIVFSSSATIYELKENDHDPIKETAGINSINPYGMNKIVIEKLLNDIYNSSPNEWSISSLRYFNPIGAHESGLLGEDPMGKPNNIFPLIMQTAIKRIGKLKIFGNDWPTSDGTGVRDYIHVLDLADAHALALEVLILEKPQILSLNLGTSKGTSVLELIKTFEKVNDIKIPYEFSERRKGDYCTVIADNSKAISVLNWSPKRNLEQMCIDGWKWQSCNPKGYI
tara:strand:+ start:1095 stop:2144 length:1050 start_codon:yes stop_codon:yes gene_type:complete